MTPTREQLLHWLAEAAELEHDLLCSYLFAWFTLKDGDDEDLEPDERAAVDRWRRTLLSVCIEEMAHLAQVANLTVALGARPHLNRPNLPVAPGYHPGAVVVELTRFDRDTLCHMIHLERPDGAPDADAATPIARTPARREHPFHWMPSGPPYETLGQFYQMLRDGLEAFARRHGEGTLFVPAADVQLRAEEIGGGGLLVVRDLATATAAIDEIVRQGEGGAADADHSHHAQFLAMRDEFDALRSRRGGFDPARDVVRNPVMHRPLEADRCQVTAPEALLLLDFANSTYALMLRCLAQVYETRWAMPAARRAICAATFDAMKAFSAVGTALTRCEAVPGQPGRAGVSFTMLRHTEGFVRPADAGRALAERTAELVAAVSGLPLGPTAQARAAAAMAALERDVGAFMEAVGVAAGGR